MKNAAYHYLHTDHLGTPQIATNQAGNITWQAEAEAFGETHLNESNQITMNLRFPGQYYDAETDTHYNYFRDYNPRTGRYQQSDPIGLAGGINHYGYVKGNPILLVDPLGLEKVCLLVTTDPEAWFLTGSHVALYGSNSSEGSWLFDPNGSYLITKGFEDQSLLITSDIVKEYKNPKWNFSIEDFAAYHKKIDNEQLRVTCAEVSLDESDKIREEALAVGGGGTFSCASNVSSALYNSGLFPKMNTSFWPNKIRFPSSTKITTRIIK